MPAYLGCPLEKIIFTLKNFKGIKHRLEFVRLIKGVKFYNNSASANPQTSAAAISSLRNEPVILIAGGKDKNLDYAPLAAAIQKAQNVKSIILIGENKGKIKKALSRVKISMVSSKNLATAIKLAYQKAQCLSLHLLSPVSILFSPGATSFDMFKDYADRGEQFKKIVRQLDADFNITSHKTI